MSNETPVQVGLNVSKLDIKTIVLHHSTPEELDENIKALIEIYGLIEGTLEGLKKEDIEGQA